MAPSALIWSYVEDENDRSIASSGVLDNEVNIADPKVSFKESSYDVDEENEVTITVELSHPSSNFIAIPIEVDRSSTAESEDYELRDLTSEDKLNFSDLSVSEEFTVAALDDDDFDDETVKLKFGTLPSTVAGTGNNARATLTIEDDDENSPPYITTRTSDPVSFDECGEGTVETYSATDPDGHPISWSLQSSRSYPDRGDFDLDDDEMSDDGILTFDDKPDFENPDDSDTNNEYKIMIRVKDDHGGSDTENVIINVRNLKPTISTRSDPPVLRGGRYRTRGEIRRIGPVRRRHNLVDRG